MADRERRVYDFKSVGESTTQELQVAGSTARAPIPIGIKTPMEFGIWHGLFRMHTDYAAQVADNLRNLIMTNHGERLGHYDFGANLLPLVFELGTDTMDSEAIRRIKTACSKYMPYVNLKTFSPLVQRLDNQHVANIGVRITYDIPRLKSGDKALEVTLYVGG